MTKGAQQNHPPKTPPGFPAPDSLSNILFLCTGNICRSPLGEGYLRKRLGEIGVTDVNVDSAGTLRLPSSPASPGSRQVAEEEGFDLSGHRSKHLGIELAKRQDLILVMERRHRELIRNEIPAVADRLFLLGDLSPETPGEEVVDPIHMPVDQYRRSFRQIQRCVESLVQYLQKGRENE